MSGITSRIICNRWAKLGKENTRTGRAFLTGNVQNGGMKQSKNLVTSSQVLGGMRSVTATPIHQCLKLHLVMPSETPR